MAPSNTRSTGWQRWLLVGLVVVLVASAFGVRVDRGDRVVTEDSILFRDNDTARRLVRLQNLVDEDKPYPYLNPQDGYPQGSVIHWTLPMDWVIIALDPVVSWAYPQARSFEAGAIWADAVLGALSVLVFAVLSMRWLGPWIGLLAAALYTFSFPAVHITVYGLGDHQALQHFFSVVALLGFACLVWRKGGHRLALVVGAALGMALWVSTESSIVFFMMTLGTLAHLLLLEPGERPAAVGLHVRWTVACLVVAFVGDRFEHPEKLFTFEWDKVSGFWLYQILVFASFLGFVRWLDPRMPARRWGAVPVAAGASVFAGVAVLVVSGLAATLGEQMELFSAANRWTQSTVIEYRALVVAFGGFYPLLAGYQLSWLILGIPLWVVGAALNQGAARSGRFVVLGMATGLFAFTCLEMKVSHLFVILYPWVLITGGAWYIERFARWLELGGSARAYLGGILGVAAVVPLFFGLPPQQSGITDDQQHMRELSQALRQLREANSDDEMRSVLAHWHWGAKLMYYADAEMVATGYHRNLAGIEDSYRVLTSMAWEDCESILRARKVRWIVSAVNNMVFAEAHDVVPSIPELMHITSSRMGPKGRISYRYDLERMTEDMLQSLLTKWHPGVDAHPNFELMYESRNKVAENLGGQSELRIWRVVYPGER